MTRSSVTLIVSLSELHTTIAESVRIALSATGHRIVDKFGGDHTEQKVAEAGRNAAAALLAFSVEVER